MLITAMIELCHDNAWLLSCKDLEGSRGREESGGGKGLYGTQRSVSEGAAQSLCCVAGLVAMLPVKEGVEGSME